MRTACLALLLLPACSVAAFGQAKRGGAILPGGDTKQPIAIEAGKLDYFDKEQKLIYTGNVVATQGASKLKASVLTILLVAKAAAKDGEPAADGGTSKQVRHMIADGPVTMVQKDQVGTGDHAVYDKVADTVVMTGNVVLTQGTNITKGDKLVYDLKSGHATVTGARVVGMFDTGESTAKPAESVDASPRKSGRKPAR